MDWLSTYHIIFLLSCIWNVFVQKVTMRNGIESFAQIKKDYFQQLEKDQFFMAQSKKGGKNI